MEHIFMGWLCPECNRVHAPTTKTCSCRSATRGPVDALTLPNMAHGRARCDAAGLRVREAPDLYAHIIGSLALDQQVTVWALSLDGKWALVQTEDGVTTGWSSLAYLSVIDDLVRTVEVPDATRC